MKQSVQTYPRPYQIVYFIDGLGMGGAERLMVPILTNLNRDLFEPRVCVFKVKGGNPIADELRANGIPVDLLPIPYLRDLTAVPRLWKYLQTRRADLVHTQLEYAATLGSFASRLRGLPNVCTIHTMLSQETSVRWKAHQQLEWFSLNWFCDRVIAVSEEARQYHIAISNSAPEKVITLYNGIDLTPYQSLDHRLERESARREFGIPLDAIALVTVAVLREAKGIQFMLRAMPSVLRSFPNAYYLVVGDGDYRPALEEEAKRAGVQTNVIFAGTRSDIPRLLAACDLFILPTLTEALPTVLAEAMAARLPIVASAVGGVPEMVVNDANGILTSPGNIRNLENAALKLLSEPVLRRQMGEAGWRIVNQKFNIKTQARQLEQLYIDLIAAYQKG